MTQYAGMSLRYVLDKQKMERKKLLNQDHIKYIVYQLLRALKYLHSAHVIHRGNLLCIQNLKKYKIK